MLVGHEYHSAAMVQSWELELGLTKENQTTLNNAML